MKIKSIKTRRRRTRRRLRNFLRKCKDISLKEIRRFRYHTLYSLVLNIKCYNPFSRKIK